MIGRLLYIPKAKTRKNIRSRAASLKLLGKCVMGQDVAALRPGQHEPHELNGSFQAIERLTASHGLVLLVEAYAGRVEACAFFNRGVGAPL